MNIVGLGAGEGIVTHGLCGVVNTRLVQCNRAHSAIGLRTGHKKIPTLRRYQNMMGEGRKIQQDLIFGGGKDVNLLIRTLET